MWIRQELATELERTSKIHRQRNSILLNFLEPDKVHVVSRYFNSHEKQQHRA